MLTKHPAAEIDWSIPEPKPPEPLPLAHLTRTILAVVVVGLLLGYLGWVLPSPGGSLVIPTLVVLGVGVFVGLAAGTISVARPSRRWVRHVALGVLAMTLVACVWTWEFSFPAFMAWSHATSQATQALNGAKNSPKLSNGAPVHPCVNVTRGSVGPMSAPLRECTITSPEGDAVFFKPLGPHSVGGMAYISSGSHWFADECAHHSYGPWWTFTASTDGVGDCPFGYSFHGGG